MLYTTLVVVSNVKEEESSMWHVNYANGSPADYALARARARAQGQI